MNTAAGVTVLGLIRDLIAAIIGLLILFGVNISDDQIAGILLVVSTAGALGGWLFLAYRRRQEPPPAPEPAPAPEPTMPTRTTRKRR